ncbi:hypothetical protein BN970_05955 [Mycolicibacterium conceptionense]|uniref:Uncharacterized protein n=1 Tax=Mycolicibacterium conceptionense TaxID=451644 RepID=A0A0U1DXK4_9MYCO|nr:hypothetical protein BN970_05955 [Mycolicibacterium conceptionense]
MLTTPGIRRSRFPAHMKYALSGNNFGELR